MASPLTQLVVPLNDPEAVDADRFGPKAANQAALGQAGLPIPDGFCLDAQAYRLQLAELGLVEAARGTTSADLAQARRNLADVRLGLFEQPIVPTVLEPFLDAWRALRERSGALTVVRSSSLMEDRAGSSFAGQFESFLGLDDEADVLTAVRACWAALWSTRALRYMEGQDLDPADMAMALVVQPLVAARASGGGMSQTAEGGMSISATWGLGSAIAQGEVVPDRFELSREGELRETAPGRKDHRVGCVHFGQEPTTSAVAKDLVSEPCLDQAQVVELARLLRRAEDVQGGPVEIEWALDDQGFKLLQARPLHMEPAQVPDQIWLRHPGLKGHPAGVGWSTGRACVINCECELGRVAPGDVLVTKVPGPALSQVLPRVAGVVAELGGSTSHLASLARERGIPMVLGVLDATQKIPDGGQVAVDGVAGVVRWIR
jgi:pyruvate,water dikinase